MLQIVNTSSTMGSWAVCPSSDSGHVHSLGILTCPPLWSLRGWKTTFRSCEQFQLLSIILFLQRLYWHHVLMDWPRLGGCWPWFGSDPEGKKQQPFGSIAEVLVLSEYPLILLWPMASYTFSPWSSECNTCSFPCNEEEAFQGHLSCPLPYSDRILNPVLCPMKTFSPLPWTPLAQSCPTLCYPVEYSPRRLLCPWDFPGQNTGVGYHFLLQGIFPTQGLNPGLPHCRQML